MQWLERQPGLLAAAVWGKLGAVWQRLGSWGLADSLPTAAELESGRLPGPDAGALALTGSQGNLGWLVWRGSAPDGMAEMASLLTGHLLSAALRTEQSLSRITNEALLEISQLAAEATTLDDLIPRLPPLLRRLVDAQHFYIACYDAEAGALSFPFYADAAHPAPRPDECFALASQPVSLLARLLRHGQPVLLTQAELQQLGHAPSLHQPDNLPRLWLGVPLYDATGGIIGAMVLLRYADQPVCTPKRNRRCLCLPPGRWGMSWSVWPTASGWSARCGAGPASWKAATPACRRKWPSASAWSVCKMRCSALPNWPIPACRWRRFSVVCIACWPKCCRARNCMVALYDREHDLIRFPYCADEQLAQLTPRRPGQGYIEQVLHSGKPLLLTPRGAEPMGWDATQGPAQSWLGVPLYCDQQLCGVLAVKSYLPDQLYRYRDQELLECVANSIGTTLARIQTTEALQSAYAELEQRVRQRTSELDAVNAQLAFDSLHDSLTKLPNRAYFAKTLRHSWEAYRQGQGSCFAVLFIDLDRFKLVNDTLGHLVGDQLLFEAGARIRACPGPDDFLARLGGDEFAVLHQQTNSLDACEALARDIVATFDRPVILAGREVFSTASVGVVLADRTHYHKADDLLRDADHAMYCTKQQGHGYTLFNHQLRINQADQLALESELRRALEHTDQLLPYYQPFIDAKTGALVGFETLVRWQHPTRGLIAPSLFLPMAEESGLITRLDRYMITAACHQLKAWLDAGRVRPDCTLHVNLSSANFHQPELVDWMAGVLAASQLPPKPCCIWKSPKVR
nr:diguanylate cyclase [Paludibacterium denitrificans]